MPSRKPIEQIKAQVVVLRNKIRHNGGRLTVEELGAVKEAIGKLGLYIDRTIELHEDPFAEKTADEDDDTQPGLFDGPSSEDPFAAADRPQQEPGN